MRVRGAEPVLGHEAEIAASAASKAAITGLTKGLSRDLGPRGITVNGVAPRSTDTGMNPEDEPASQYQKSLSRFD
ncbi:SDR family NAD(P)-dependent oxidoreductase [Streptomyces sp. bgisy126]|uniref:SDR family NAD(P)-dependent oxidoreductase n=1 Tax=unclassified Streptomyces TaxID=2593676 RepID=UPI003EBB77D4